MLHQPAPPRRTVPPDPLTALGLTCRPLTGEDTAAVARLYTAMSDRDRRNRFFFPLPGDLGQLAAAAVRNDTTHASIGAFDGELLVGVANYIALDGTEAAEVAVVVAGKFQEHGVATALLRRLADTARAHGIRHLLAEVLPTNSKMMRLLIEADFPISAQRQDGIAYVDAVL
ncbi:N-acetyltransferase family protein [Nocardia thailandica]|uniref:GNAT family N-acetyltransferase n=1 Tax=Nocardia thailandica TaxID=257275 RepID=UPI0002ED99D5|nr:GNAT family N-acetyltransferase [Nocardia thailandica]